MEAIMASARMTALLAALAVVGYQNRHRLGEMFAQATGSTASGAPGGAQRGGGLLGSLFGGGAQAGSGGGLLSGLLGGGGSHAGVLSGGLGELVQQFTGSGQGDVAKSWVGTGPNKEIGTQQLEQALGQDTINSLTQQTGLSRDELLSRLKSVLPAAVDKLTPEGHVPSEAEAKHWT
jgi:uncharacterized protein YidB (DUF937 family)